MLRISDHEPLLRISDHGSINISAALMAPETLSCYPELRLPGLRSYVLRISKHELELRISDHNFMSISPISVSGHQLVLCISDHCYMSICSESQANHSFDNELAPSISDFSCLR